MTPNIEYIESHFKSFFKQILSGKNKPIGYIPEPIKDALKYRHYGKIGVVPYSVEEAVFDLIEEVKTQNELIEFAAKHLANDTSSCVGKEYQYHLKAVGRIVSKYIQTKNP